MQFWPACSLDMGSAILKMSLLESLFWPWIHLYHYSLIPALWWVGGDSPVKEPPQWPAELQAASRCSRASPWLPPGQAMDGALANSDSWAQNLPSTEKTEIHYDPMAAQEPVNPQNGIFDPPAIFSQCLSTIINAPHLSHGQQVVIFTIEMVRHKMLIRGLTLCVGKQVGREQPKPLPLRAGKFIQNVGHWTLFSSFFFCHPWRFC